LVIYQESERGMSDIHAGGTYSTHWALKCYRNSETNK